MGTICTSKGLIVPPPPLSRATSAQRVAVSQMLMAEVDQHISCLLITNIDWLGCCAVPGWVRLSEESIPSILFQKYSNHSEPLLRVEARRKK